MTKQLFEEIEYGKSEYGTDEEIFESLNKPKIRYDPNHINPNYKQKITKLETIGV